MRGMRKTISGPLTASPSNHELTRTCCATTAVMPSPIRATTRGRFRMVRAPIDHVDGGVHGTGAKVVQGFLAGVRALGGCDGCDGR
jgi:hypothetical protein